MYVNSIIFVIPLDGLLNWVEFVNKKLLNFTAIVVK